MSLLDAAASAVGLGGSDAAPALPPAKPDFYRAAWLDSGGEESKGSVAGGGVANALDSGEAIEFIHFGHVHPDWHTNFENQAEVSDVDFPDLEQEKGRGVLFRAALLRETLLVDGFVAACKTVLADYRSSQGSLGDIASAASSLLGGGAPKPKPKPEDLDKTVAMVRAAGGSLNRTPVKYTDVHKAGVDLTQAWADYDAFARTLGPDKSAGLLPPLPGPAAAAAGILFKLQDVHLKMYLSVREGIEPAIREASYQIGMAAIGERKVPIFPVWSPKEKPAAPEGGGDNGNDLIKPIKEKVEEIKSDIEEKKKQLREFLGCAEAEKAPGDPYLKQIFAKLESSHEWIVKAFQLVVDDVPGFLCTLTREIVAANVKVLRAAYARLMLRPEEPIGRGLLIAAGREAITRRVLEVLPGGNLLEGGPSVSMGDLSVGTKTLGDKLVDFLDDNVTSKIDFIIELAVGDLADQMNSKRASGGSPMTMEVLLAPLPMWLARMTRDIVFPIWKLLVDAVFGNVTGALGGTLGSIGSGLDKVKGAVGDAKTAYDNISKFDGFDSSKDMGALKELATDPSQFAKDQIFGKGGGGSGGGPPPPFPGSPRVGLSRGDTVTKDQVDSAQHKWDDARPETAPAKKD